MTQCSSENIRIRHAAVAGMFYPDSPQALRHDIERLFALAENKSVLSPKALIVPHAGYLYSGATAAAAYALWALERDVIKRVVIMGPTHRIAVDGLVLPESDAFETPLGLVPVDKKAVAMLLDMPQVTLSAAAHTEEHALEVQLPFLQVLLSAFSIVPLLVGDATTQSVAKVIERLWGDNDTRFVISSDLSHYLTDTNARRTDAETLDRIIALEPNLQMQHACGASPINGLLVAAAKHKLRPQLLDCCNSGKVSGDKHRVVGYAAFVFGLP